MRLLALTALLLQCLTTAARLYAASYSGTITSITFSKHNDLGYQLSNLSQTNDCGPSSSWLVLDGESDIFYCLDEGIDRPNATLTSFRTFSNDMLSSTYHLQTIPGLVDSTFYTAAYSAERFLAVAH
jgi:hypothetical protein